VPWLAVVMHGLLSSVFFFATGHQATIPTIRFESAFTGFHGDFNNNMLPALLITLNTFAAPIFFTAASPLLLFWPHLLSPVSRWLVGQSGVQGREWKGDFVLFDNDVLLRKNLFSSCCRLLLFHAAKVSQPVSLHEH
jgi:phosphatidylinositol glycan class O